MTDWPFLIAMLQALAPLLLALVVFALGIAVAIWGVRELRKK